VNQNVPIDCDGVYASWSLKKSTKPTLKLRVEARGTQPKFKKLKLTFSKGIKLNKKLLAKKLTLKGDKKKLKSKCFRYSKPNVLEIGLCGKKYLAIDAAFIKGALIGAKKIKKPTLKIQATPASGKASTFKLDLSQEITPPVPVG
jgi:hypothetical protein